MISPMAKITFIDGNCRVVVIMNHKNITVKNNNETTANNCNNTLEVFLIPTYHFYKNHLHKKKFICNNKYKYTCIHIMHLL